MNEVFLQKGGNMQEKDVLSLEYFEDPSRFADLLNGYIYQGKQVVSAADVKSVSGKVTRVEGKEKGIRTKTITADIAKHVFHDMHVLVVFLENQSDVHYAMPVRIMNEESACYHQQWRQIAGRHQQEKDLKGAEYISGFGKEDKLQPVITFVIYWGQRMWDGPRCLKEMLDLSTLPPQVEGMIADYPIHLLEVRRFKHSETFVTDMKYVFGFLQREQDHIALKNYVEENREVFARLPEDTYRVISVMSGSKELENSLKKVENAGGYDMCQAIRDMIEEGREEGREENCKLWSMLIMKMTENGMLEDIPKLAEDTAFFEKMVQKYKI